VFGRKVKRIEVAQRGITGARLGAAGITDINQRGEERVAWSCECSAKDKGLDWVAGSNDRSKQEGKPEGNTPNYCGYRGKYCFLPPDVSPRQREGR